MNNCRDGMSWKRWGAALVLAAGVSGCATTADRSQDPLEPFNRAMFQFNDGLDSVVVKPVGEAYRSVIPGILRAGVTNFFSNLQDLWIGANNLLQGKVEEGLTDFFRVVANTFIGFTVMDVATEMGMTKHNEDFGQTLGRWGVASGPYLVLPFFGPSTIRDGASMLVDFKGDPVLGVRHVPTRNALYATRVVSNRSELLDATRVVEEAALDKYLFVRDSYLQRRRSLIYDGNPPPDDRSEADEPATAGVSPAEKGDAAPTAAAESNPVR